MKKHTLLFACLLSFVGVGLSQNVGINTPTPAGALHIKGGSDVSQLIIEANSTQSNTSPLLKLRNSLGNDLLWIHSDNFSNMFIGLHAGQFNNAAASGLFNTFIGSETGFSNTTGDFNTANGASVLYSNITGSNNTGNGAGALYSNTTGDYNTANGSYSLITNTTGSKNTTSGYGSLFSNVSGIENTAHGAEALLSNTTGNNNTAYGYRALYSSTTGNNNTAFGHGADVSTGEINNATAIGAKAFAGTSNSVVIGSINGVNGATANANVSIGTAIPHSSAALEVNSPDRGVLVPRLALTAANVASPVTSPVDALLIFNTATSGAGTNAVEPGFYYWNANANRWNTMSRSSSNGSSGFGTWGDCITSVTEYNPVADESGESGDGFGGSVAISGNYAIIGAPSDDGPGYNQGSVIIYQFNGTYWEMMQKITDAPGEDGALFGTSVSISGNYAIVGAIYDGTINEGSASIFQYNGTNWVLMQKLTDPNPVIQEYFGVSVSIFDDYAAVGAYGDDLGAGENQGSVSVYEYNGTSWVLMQKIIDATGSPSDFFGGSVSLSEDRIIIGASSDDVGPNVNQGSVSIFQYNGTSWVLMDKITDTSGESGDLFGGSVSIDGDYALIGAEREDVGANIEQGSASFYKYNGTSWLFIEKITDPIGTGEDYFGSTVNISGNYATIGSFYSDINSNIKQGAAHIYLRVGLGWQRFQYLTDPGGNAYDYFGYSTAINGASKRFLIGATGGSGGAGKVIFGKLN